MCKLPQVSGFCGCMPLRSGALFITVLSLITSAIFVILCSYGSATIHSREFFPTTNATENSTNATEVANEENNRQYQLALITIVWALYIASAVISAIHLGFDISAVVGIVKNKSGLVRAWVIFNAVFTALAFIFYISYIFLSAVDDPILGFFLFGMSHVGISMYFLVVVKSYHRVMVDKQPL